jgi:hypothetical protein
MKLPKHVFFMTIQLPPTEVIAMNVALVYYFRWGVPDPAMLKPLKHYLERLREQAEQFKSRASIVQQEWLFPLQVTSHEAIAMGVALDAYVRRCPCADPLTVGLARQMAQRLLTEVEREKYYAQLRSATTLSSDRDAASRFD